MLRSKQQVGYKVVEGGSILNYMKVYDFSEKQNIIAVFTISITASIYSEYFSHYIMEEV
jgi:hypothetical protein